MRIARAPLLRLSIGSSRVQAQAVRGDTIVWAGEATYESSADLTEVVARLAAEPSERCRRLDVIIERPPAQTRTLTDLPPVRARELGPLVANQAGRFFRRNGAPLVTDAVRVANGHGPVVQAAAIEEPLVLAIVAGAKQAGLSLDTITAAGLVPEIQLLPVGERVTRRRASRRSVLRIAIAVAAIWVLAGAAFVARLLTERRAVDAELSASAAPLAALRQVRQEMRTAEVMVQSLAEARRTQGEALVALARVSASLPDSAVFTSYSWHADGSGVVSGTARRAANVLAALERTHVLSSPRLEGAVVHETVAGHEWERFTIVFGGSTP